MDAIKHPSYLHAIDQMDKAGIDYGKTWTAQEIAEMVRMKPESVEFSFAVMGIREELRKRGYNFTSRGTNGQNFFIAPPETNADEMMRMQRKAVKSLINAVVLGSTTDKSRLTDEQQKRHEAVLERAATRAALISRTTKALHQ